MTKLLVADDEPALRDMVGDLFRAAGFAVRTAHSGAAALAEIRRSPPDLAVLDYRMGRPDGFEVCSQVKGDPRLEHIPVLILTGEGEVDHRVRAFEAGADDFLAKPFDPRELLGRVRAMLRLASQGLDRNPTTGLPGSEAVRREIGRRLDAAEGFALCYADLDHFKPFADRFGFLAADQVIRAAGDALRAAAGEIGFVGHIGGDDFVMLAPAGTAREQVLVAQAAFRDALAPHVGAETVDRGWFRGRDREGVERDFPLTRMSAAIVRVGAGESNALEDFAPLIAEAKQRAKQAADGVVEVSAPEG